MKEIKEVIYANNCGLGIITNGIEESEFIDKIEVEILGQKLIPESMTNLNGYFFEDVKYCGLKKDSEHIKMIFYTGENSDLFDTKKYYYCLYLINNKRIANVYAHGSCRDFIFKNGKWK
jgi:hypothetical protein